MTNTLNAVTIITYRKSKVNIRTCGKELDCVCNYGIQGSGQSLLFGFQMSPVEEKIMLPKLALMLGTGIVLIVVMCLVIRFLPASIIPDAIIDAINTSQIADKRHPFTKDTVLAFVAGGVAVVAVGLLNIVLIALGVDTRLAP